MTENLLAHETSPYLLQHRDNPVHWRPWGPAAFAEAKDQNKPILLSVGYAACHWCHVMAHESFEDPETASLMNELFVNIKVDREERPDIDKIYMQALQEMGEHGGWPLTMFLTPDGAPFWGGTYFAKEPQHGRPGFRQVLREIARVYREAPDHVTHNTHILTQALNRQESYDIQAELSLPLIDQVAGRLLQLLDRVNGGLQGAPKFPQTALLEMLWRSGLRDGPDACLGAVSFSLERMAQGGIYDHLGGGFARYATDERWLVPHFEKMLYDNALLLRLMTLVWQRTRSELLRTRIDETAAWVLREMVTESGAFASSLDADSEGQEGRFYVWQYDEVRDLLPAEDFALFAAAYDVTPEGNWEGKTILNRLNEPADLTEVDEQRLADCRTRLFQHRESRARPGWDDKVLSDWNGLMISALALAGRVFARPQWTEAAARAFDVIRTRMWRDGHLLHSMRLGEARHLATAEGYANMIHAALTLYETTAETGYLEHARSWYAQARAFYWDDDQGGFHFTSARGEVLIARIKQASDDATPNANGTMLSNLARLYGATGENGLAEDASRLIKAFEGPALANLFAHASFLNGFADWVEPVNCVVAGDPGDTGTQRLVEAVYAESVPALALVHSVDDGRDLPPGHPAYGKKRVDGKPTLYVCRGQACSAPVTEANRVGALLIPQPH